MYIPSSLIRRLSLRGGGGEEEMQWLRWTLLLLLATLQTEVYGDGRHYKEREKVW